MRGIAIVMLTALAALLAVAAPVLAEGGDGFSEYCSSHGDLGLSHGGCVAFFTTRNVTPHDASVCQDPGIRAFLGVDNHGQCVKKLKEMRGGN